NSACIDNEARYNQARQYGFSEKISFLPGTNYPPNNKTIPEIAKEEGICEGTLYNWRKAARAESRLMPDGDNIPTGWCAADKFAAVVETASMNEAELSGYCRERGLYAEQIVE
ncbi:MAG: hypothetical protein KZQ66_17860, partial [Candidatus Thiodiazotropha sp. (ex Lucinoma aequizonata)]|nr:hypothetical protein [Candidatus Thiodiazotropha sp. (ex Lucinoma aequizonata)]MCU7896625.1 hypothetical protein [Candidatus Thiodiazotropha sp. (ex Lucinoma aequizonata)]MCU7903618.1 hypothetical protein [Candidatus Thiodiazotropha sp. (ex Lucinoma aequizonata)]MCU7909694.1 hypothetical protein [Candidatus Thiodiazotropha sp. (ex Lucinoma aequizonata)]MCU7911284.1 hypothetical protein [Candidatus Thiodiazotropha sp. (ex Lucinoma aequizonata)]